MSKTNEWAPTAGRTSPKKGAWTKRQLRRIRAERDGDQREPRPHRKKHADEPTPVKWP